MDRMEIGGPYPEEIILEAYNLEWESIELRRQRLKKSWRQFLVTVQMEQEDRRYKRQLRRIKCREKEVREQVKRQQEEALRRQREEERAEVKKKKEEKKVVVNGTPKEEDVILHSKKANTMKVKVVKTKMQPKQVKRTKPKRIAPISLPPLQPEENDSVAEEEQNGRGGHESSPSELPDDGLLNLLTFNKGCDSDGGDEPSMMSLILPVAQDSPNIFPSKKTMSAPQTRFVKKRRDKPLDFDFTNAEAKRQAKAAEAALGEQHGSDENDTEPEPMPAPSVSTSKKRLKRRKEVAKERQQANGVKAPGGTMLMTAMANTTISIKSKKKVLSDEATTSTNVARKKTIENGTISRGALSNTKSKNAQVSTEAERKTGLSSKKTTNGKTETMSIKQRLANVELLAQMNKMQDINTPKVLGKKTKKTQKQEAEKTLAKRAEMQNVLSRGTEEANGSRPDQMIEERELNISLNSSGLISDNDSPENLCAPTQKRPRVAVQGDVTPTKKLQFFEITKRLVKSPMPRFLRTPTPLTSPTVPSALVNQKAASPAPRAASARNTAPNNNEARRMNSAPVRPKKTINANRFGVPIGASLGTGSGSFSMFDAFVNSGTGGAIPRLRTKARGNL